MIQLVTQFNPFDFYERGINEILRRGEGLTFTPYDIYHHLKSNRCHLYRMDDAGFFVVEKCVETISGDAFMNVWLMWFAPGEGVPHKAELLEALDNLQRFYGCKWTDFGTTRKAWGELLKGEFVEHMVTYRRNK